MVTGSSITENTRLPLDTQSLGVLVVDVAIAIASPIVAVDEFELVITGHHIECAS